MAYSDLAKAALEKAPIQAKRYVLWDSEQKGLGVRVTPYGERTFVVKTRMGRGRFAEQRWVTIGKVGHRARHRRLHLRLRLGSASAGDDQNDRR